MGAEAEISERSVEFVAAWVAAELVFFHAVVWSAGLETADVFAVEGGGLVLGWDMLVRGPHHGGLDYEPFAYQVVQRGKLVRQGVGR